MLKFKIILKNSFIVVYKKNKIFFKQFYLKNKIKFYTYFYVIHFLIKYGYFLQSKIKK